MLEDLFTLFSPASGTAYSKCKLMYGQSFFFWVIFTQDGAVHDNDFLKDPGCMLQVPLRGVPSPLQIHGLEQGGTPRFWQLPRHNLRSAHSSSPLAHQPGLLLYCLGPCWSLINWGCAPETAEGWGWWLSASHQAPGGLLACWWERVGGRFLHSPRLCSAACD